MDSCFPIRSGAWSARGMGRGCIGRANVDTLQLPPRTIAVRQPAASIGQTNRESDS